jgi:hypothetical protein
MGQGSAGTEAKGEKKLKGCIKSEGGQTVLEEKGGKSIPLTGTDVSAHNGHEVAVHGTWESASAASSSGGASAKGGRAFNVTSVDMISESCSAGGKKGKSGSMGSNPPPSSQE